MVQDKNVPSYTAPADEISIKLFLKIVISYIQLVIKRWYFVIFFFALFGYYEYRNINKIIETYPAKIKVYIRPQDIAKENQQLIKVFSQLLNSRSLTEQLLMEKVVINGENQLLINHYLFIFYELKPDDLDVNIPKGFYLKNTELKNLSLSERKILNLVVEKLITPLGGFSDGFISIGSEFELGFVTLNISTPSEELSLAIIEKLYNLGVKLVKRNTVFAQNKAFEKLNNETDSLSREYKATYIKLNNYKDRRAREITQEEPDVKTIKYLEKKIHKYEVRSEIFKTQYLASLEQEKFAQIELDQKSLLIHEMERTSAPIESYKPSSKVAGIKFGIVGSFLAIFLIVLSRIYSNIVRELKDD
ncbi:MAG: hypothetical protein AB8F74_09480 [Saprospiraceae bacterium]